MDDTYVSAIARDFAVSREVIINRLWSIGVIDQNTYFETLRRYSDEYLAYKVNKKKDGLFRQLLIKGCKLENYMQKQFYPPIFLIKLLHEKHRLICSACEYNILVLSKGGATDV